MEAAAEDADRGDACCVEQTGIQERGERVAQHMIRVHVAGVDRRRVVVVVVIFRDGFTVVAEIWC